MPSSDDVFFGVTAPEGYIPADEAAIARLVGVLRTVVVPNYPNLETLEGAIALETLAGEIRGKVAKGGVDAGEG